MLLWRAWYTLFLGFEHTIFLSSPQWPYSYDSCDVGTVANQTHNGEPLAALTNGDPAHGDALSYLPGQRLSRCTCKGESHPGPVHSDGTYVGRSAPEIDIFESQVCHVIHKPHALAHDYRSRVSHFRVKSHSLHSGL